MTQTLVCMPAKGPLKDQPVGSAVEKRAPLLKFANTVRSFLRMELGHAPMVKELAAAHGVAEMRSPVICTVHISHGCCDATFRHDGVSLTKQGFANHADRRSLTQRLDSRAQTGATRTNNQDIMFVCFELCSHRIVRSRSTPAATSRM